jgi:mono/diheme cytochrome c family protein
VNPVPENELSLLRGEKAYNGYCLACHGENLDGFGPVGPSLPAKIPPLDGQRVISMSDGELYWHLLNGGTIAPPMGLSMTRQERWDVINFLRFKQERVERIESGE